MDLRLTQDQRHLVGAFAGLYADHAGPDVAAAAEPEGHDARLWDRVRKLGALDLALEDDEIGHTADLLDLALVAEQHGRYLAPTPMIEAQVALRLLARIGVAPQDDRLVTLALVPGRNGRAPLVPAGAIADDALILDGDRLLLVPLEGRRQTVANLGSLPLADVTLDGDEPVVATGADLVAAAVDEWRVLTAAALTGLAARALEIGVAYVKQRKAFGRPVGQFQAVAHRLADRATDIDGAELLAREAAWAQRGDPGRFRELASMALAFAAETAVTTSHDVLHFHGGYGFMLEYPCQLYYRRARTWGAVLESPAQAYRRVGAA